MGFAPEAFRRLAQIVGGPKPKKKDKNCPPDIALNGLQGAAVTWSMVVNSLPVKVDEDEAKKVHDKLVDLVLAQNAGLLGPNHSNLGKVLSVLAEVYHVEAICTKETEEKIVKIFKMLPVNILQQNASAFSEKQQKKIETIVNS